MSTAYVNFFGGSPLNRLSWLRTSPNFLNAIALRPTTRWLLFQGGQPLLLSEPITRKRSLARLSTADVRPLLGSEPFFSQGQVEGEHAPSDVLVLESARLRGPPLVFLGLHEPQAVGGEADALPSSEFSAKSDAETVIANLTGTPYFSLDVTQVEQTVLDKTLLASEPAKAGAELTFFEPRGAMAYMDAFEKGLHNFAHPRTDAVVIMAIIDEAGEKVLLGRNRKWPEKFYSALAGFMEPGESFEDAVKREIWEEVGVRVWNVQYHSTQPWPYPASLMVGFYATADSSQPLRKDLDNELEDAQWWTREQVLQVLSNAAGTNLTDKDHSRISEAQEQQEQHDHEALKSSTANARAGEALPKDGKAQVENSSASGLDEVPFRIPPLTAVAGVLVNEWAYRRAGPGSGVAGQSK
ncbi:hypothetical protein POSPLADRAFT_1052468 [Postia placenta MAD-698-R-SB12]|uniref:NAD(+) diphosphatase n=1 Tax=Postia placenta MAD-698-R-SB12 TaxID=670580 RepID=A0A1X6NB25_9APHY|nr:hypothetical protein POSPLADRAFT_1052468 [Postia placenta MAD-698-R-SB12]OSX65801.1 hypothetical protein POSPLADRAFT_1052468 [Postia placenta MAD-698-R-SB12]